MTEKAIKKCFHSNLQSCSPIVVTYYLHIRQVFGNFIYYYYFVHTELVMLVWGT